MQHGISANIAVMILYRKNQATLYRLRASYLFFPLILLRELKPSIFFILTHSLKTSPFLDIPRPVAIAILGL